ncbi:MAG: DHH family phosphoesterase [Nitrososphaerales archaeon]
MAKSSIVISHRKDADGISSAALIRHLTGAEIFLTDYADMVETLSTVGPADDYYICDLGSNQNTFGGFLEQMNRFLASGKVHYIDHHPLSTNSSSILENAGVELTHSVEECTSVLIYRKYEKDLKESPKMKIAACCGAITDYMDTKPFAKKIISAFDRQFLLYEATVLSFTISTIGRGSADSNTKLIELSKEIAEVEMMLPKTKYERGIVNISTIVIATIKNPIIWSYLLLEGWWGSSTRKRSEGKTVTVGRILDYAG